MVAMCLSRRSRESHFEVFVGEAELLVQLPSRIVRLNMQGDVATGSFECGIHEHASDSFASMTLMRCDVNQYVLRDVPAHSGVVHDQHAYELVAIVCAKHESTRTVDAIHGVVDGSLDVFGLVAVRPQVFMQKLGRRYAIVKIERVDRGRCGYVGRHGF